MSSQLQPPSHSTHSAAGSYREAALAVTLTEQQQRSRIAVAAYYIAERRHFEPGHEMEDWLAAEMQIGSDGITVS